MKPKGLEILALNTSNTTQETRKVMRELKLTFLMAMDQKGQSSLKEKMNVFLEPCLVLVGKDRKTIKSWNTYSFNQIRSKAATLGVK